MNRKILFILVTGKSLNNENNYNKNFILFNEKYIEFVKLLTSLAITVVTMLMILDWCLFYI